jgi:hypothetical protein
MSNDKIADFLGLDPLPTDDEEEDRVFKERPSKIISDNVHDGDTIEDVDFVEVEPTSKAPDVYVPPPPLTVAQDELIDDIEKARNNIGDIIDVGKDSLEFLVKLAKASQSARAFEVVNMMMKTLIDADKERVGMTERKKFAKEDHPANQGAGTTNVTNNNLILTSAQMLELMLERKEKSD